MASKKRATMVASECKEWQSQILPAFNELTAWVDTRIKDFNKIYPRAQAAHVAQGGAAAAAWDDIAPTPPLHDATLFIKWFDNIALGIAPNIKTVTNPIKDYNVEGDDLATALNATAQYCVDTLASKVIGVLQDRHANVMSAQAAAMWLQGKTINLTLMDGTDSSPRVGTLMRILGLTGERSSSSKDRMALQRQRSSVEACRSLHRFNKEAVLLWMTMASAGGAAMANKALAFLDRLDDKLWFTQTGWLRPKAALRPTNMLVMPAKPEHPAIDESGHRKNFTIHHAGTNQSPFLDCATQQKMKGYESLKIPHPKPKAAPRPVGDSLKKESRGYSSADDDYKLKTAVVQGKGIGVFNAGKRIPSGVTIATCVGQLRESSGLTDAQRNNSVDLQTAGQG
jgi:hypothetical protein